MIRTLVVDDEALAREGLVELVGDESDLELVGECVHGAEALEFLREEEVDLVLLDVQMPELDGFELLARLDAEGHPVPVVIFVTAYDHYALEAFRVHAIDYLLKPVQRDRFRAALQRARGQLRYRGEDGDRRRFRELIDHVERRRSGIDRLLVKTDGRAFFVEYDSIDWVEAQGNYVLLHTSAGDHLVRDTMTNMAEELEPKGFARIHRSSIVNLDRVREIQPWFKGDHLVILEDGTELSLTRKYRRTLEERLRRKI